MNIDEYVKKSAQNIGSAAERKQFEKELKNHIPDRIEYYTEVGSFLIAQIAFFGLCRKGRHYAVSCALLI